MIVGIGIDAVENTRFDQWHTYKKEQLEKVFSPQELTYCLSNPPKRAERFAARFAAKEAFFKALTTATQKTWPLFSVCKAAQVASTPTGPRLDVAWDHLNLSNTSWRTHLSLSHTKKDALAIVILEKAF